MLSEEEKAERRRARDRKRYAATREQKQAYAKKQYALNREKRRATAKKKYDEIDPNKLRAAHLRRRYNLTLEQFEEMSASQGHVCLICGKAGELVVDHCHKTGRVRGLPCRLCNKGIGIFRDDPVILHAVIKYLEGCKS